MLLYSACLGDDSRPVSPICKDLQHALGKCAPKDRSYQRLKYTGVSLGGCGLWAPFKNEHGAHVSCVMPYSFSNRDSSATKTYKGCRTQPQCAPLLPLLHPSSRRKPNMEEKTTESTETPYNVVQLGVWRVLIAKSSLKLPGKNPWKDVISVFQLLYVFMLEIYHLSPELFVCFMLTKVSSGVESSLTLYASSRLLTIVRSDFREFLTPLISLYLRSKLRSQADKRKSPPFSMPS